MTYHHYLKIKPEFFDKQRGIKTAELRKNDRDFQTGDTLTLQEFDSVSGYTGGFVKVHVQDVTDVSEYAPGYVLISIERE